MKNNTDQGEPSGPHRWRPGESGNPKGRPRKGDALSEAIRAKVDPDELVEIALTLARDPSESSAARLQALAYLADRGYVKPAERHELAVEHVAPALPATWDSMFRAEREGWLAHLPESTK